jgi:hypothetical protein
MACALGKSGNSLSEARMQPQLETINTSAARDRGFCTSASSGRP